MRPASRISISVLTREQQEQGDKRERGDYYSPTGSSNIRSNRLFINVTPKSLQKHSFDSARDIQEHSKRLSQNYIYTRSNIFYIKIYIHIKKGNNET